MLTINRVMNTTSRRFVATGTTMVRKATTSTGTRIATDLSSASPVTSAARATLASPSSQTTKRVQGYSKNLQETLGSTTLEESSQSSFAAPSSSEINWYTSFYGIGSKPFSEKVQSELALELNPDDIEIKPDGLIYLPEIKYRRILNKAFGPGGWGLVPRSDTIVTAKLVTREYALVCHGQLVSIARGEQDYFSETGIPTATEGCKSNALMRCCKDLGIGSELWDPVFIKSYKKKHCTEKFVEHVTTKKKKKIWLRKDREVEYPYK